MKQLKFEIILLKRTYRNTSLLLEGGPGGAVDDVCDCVSDAWDDVTDCVSDAWNDVTDCVSDAWEDTCDFVSDGWEDVCDVAGDIWDEFGDEIIDIGLIVCGGPMGVVLGAYDLASEDFEIREFAEEVWEEAAEIWDEYKNEIIMTAAIVVSSWIPGVNALVAGAVIGALQAGMESGWNLEAMAVGAAAGALSGCGATVMGRATYGAASGALKSGYASGWDMDEMAEGALVSGVLSGVGAELKVNGAGDTVEGKIAYNAVKGGMESGARNDWDVEDMALAAVTSGAAAGAGAYAAESESIAAEAGEKAVVNAIKAGYQTDWDFKAMATAAAAGGGGHVAGTIAANALPEDIGYQFIEQGEYGAISAATSAAIYSSVYGGNVMKNSVPQFFQGGLNGALHGTVEDIYAGNPELKSGAFQPYAAITAHSVADGLTNVFFNGDFSQGFERSFTPNIDKTMMQNVAYNLTGQASGKAAEQAPQLGTDPEPASSLSSALPAEVSAASENSLNIPELINELAYYDAYLLEYGSDDNSGTNSIASEALRERQAILSIAHA